jgi:cytoskeleton protein RodZ
VRGFIRNYARLLRVDAEPLLHAGNLGPPASVQIERIAPTMGELPANNAGAAPWTRWLIPAGLVLVLAAGIAFYEFGGVSYGTKRRARRRAKQSSRRPRTRPPMLRRKGMACPPAGRLQQRRPPHHPDPASTSLPGVRPPLRPQFRRCRRKQRHPVRRSLRAVHSRRLPPIRGASTSNFLGTSWVEIRDGRGEVLVSRTFTGKDPQQFTGVPPLSLKIGNANAVRLQFNGTPVDLAPHTQREIARLTLPLPRR